MWPDFIEGPHHKKIADKFNKLAQGKIKRLIINMPPRHTKSEFASYLFPAWMMGKNPKMKIIQMIIYTYFKLRGTTDVKKKEEYIDRILFLSASNKLKIKFDGKNEVEKQVVTKDKYKKNKELAKLFCIKFLDENWKTFFMEHKKRDDLADTFLMNIYQLQIDKK